MARLLYGNSPADFTTAPTGRLLPGSVLTVWTAVTGGTQVTDLQDYLGNATTVVTSDEYALVRFYGPDGENDTLWLDGGTGVRLLVRPSVLTAELGDGSVMDEDINAAADIARSKIAGTALTAASMGVFNVLDYGAVGDGTHDDTAELQAAITAAVAVGGTVLIPPGTYKISDALTVDGPVTITGTGTIHQTATDAYGLTITASDVTVEGITLTGRHATSSLGSDERGISAVGAY